ncbi:leucine-rich repeat domain-containing protein [Paraburkholderia agricolaris]|uniref:leucine-rich repeat domain-containing protein n=1 Tax=Paraburkholderia agricolaris TaxID=2152888 RepID=UPI00142EDB3C|nr:leucine-rich repeat domain-containing protein [Paraburkholderia agricolaris]
MTDNISPPSTRTLPPRLASTGANPSSSTQTQRVGQSTSFFSTIKGLLGQVSIGQPGKPRLGTAQREAGPAMKKFMVNMENWAKDSPSRQKAAHIIATWLANGEETRLLLSECKLDCTPPGFEEIDEIRQQNGGRPLKHLNLSGNPFVKLSISFDKFLQLEELDLSSCKLRDVPDSIGRSNDLRKLSLGNNELSSVPDTIFSLPKLETLRIHQNDIEEIPAAISNAGALKHLSAAFLPISSLPASLTKLKGLLTLDVSVCANLHALPADIGTLPLKHLAIRNTPLEDLPGSVDHLKDCKIDLRGNQSLQQQRVEDLRQRGLDILVN